MRPAWRLAINSISERPSRSVFLVAAVALAAALVTTVACAIRSINSSVEQRLTTTVGAGDLRVRTAGGGGLGNTTFDAALLDVVRAWPEVRSAVPRLYAPVALQFPRPTWGPLASPEDPDAGPLASDQPQASGASPIPLEWRRVGVAAMGVGVDPSLEQALRPVRFVAGDWPKDQNQVVLDELGLKRLNIEPQTNIPLRLQGADERAALNSFAQRLTPPAPGDANLEQFRAASSGDLARAWNQAAEARAGDVLEFTRPFRGSQPLTLVGVAAQPPLGGRIQAYFTLSALQQLVDQPSQLSEIDLVLQPGFDPQSVAASRSGEMPEGVMLITTERVTSGVHRNVKANELGFVLASVMSFLAAGFIITTAMTTNVAERQRELAILRCIGSARIQLAEAQLVAGSIIGALGALVGAPTGVAIAWLIFQFVDPALNVALIVPASALFMGMGGAIAAGIFGASIPAWKASRVSPLAALASRAGATKAAGIARVLVASLIACAIPLACVTLPADGQLKFWTYATLGLPSLFIGYFLLAVPVVVGVAIVLEPILRRVFSLPPRVVARSIRATPFRFGFTAGAMMFGMAVMVAIWTQGNAILRDWLGKLEFPDGFVLGISLSPAAENSLREVPGVAGTSAITMHPISTDSFGVRAIQEYKSTFIAFEPEDFFEMAELQWIQGDEASARVRLAQGGAIIVAKEFLVANELGLGDTFRCVTDEGVVPFEIVGVVHSPGLDLVSKFFQIGDEYVDQAIHAVFGTRRDLKEKLLAGQEPPIQLIQFALSDDANESEVVRAVRERMIPFGVLEVGSGRRVKRDITEFIESALLISSVVSLVAMVVGALGVANLIIAGIRSRQFEFGVLRAVGASHGAVVRLVLAEASLVGVTAAIVGTLMGSQAVYCGQQLDAAILGLSLNFRPPLGPIAVGTTFVLVVTLLAATPAVMSLAKRKPRELLAAMRG
ncbi:MAG: FtsX-like permease family protein [Planctomycetota bacterium]|nr:FtsX-like permease family protein [Planctomycetota bacterium]